MSILFLAVSTVCLSALAAPGLPAAGTELLTPAATPSAPNNQPIPWADLGAKATAQYSGDGLAVFAAENGAVRLRCVFQRLAGEVTSDGLWLSSTVEGAAANRFRVVADSVGRDDGGMMALPRRGVAAGEPGRAHYLRPGLVEEYSVSVDGVRQDFLVTDVPGGTGALRVELAVSGARAEAAADAVQLVLDGAGRKLVYSRLRVVDAQGRTLPATMQVVAETRLAVVVDDAAAVYPVRIDPTFSDANWISMGGLLANDTVYAAVVDSAGNLYVGGDFTAAGDVTANRIAKWNGSAWSALGSGVNGYVYALAVSGTDLYAGGAFTYATNTGPSAVNVNYIAKWSGGAWTALGLGMNNSVGALAVSGADLYVGGGFTTAGGSAAYRIAKWDGSGSTWSALGSGMNGYVRALAVSGTDLYAGGDFTYATNAGPTAVNVNRIAKWSSGAWTALGSGMNNSVRALVMSSTDLYAGGDFTYATNASAVNVNYIAKWSSGAWTALGSGMNNSVRALAASGTGLYAGGDFTYATNASAVNVNYIAKWSSGAWTALVSGMNNSVRALAVSGSDLYAGGAFTTAGGSAANRIAKWSGSGWSALGSGMGGGKVRALAVSGSDLYAGGEFTTAGGSAANRIAKWNGSVWSALGSGMNSYVYALAVSGPNLYAGGSFTTAGGVSANYIAKWNGSTWSPLGSGMNSTVQALAVSGANLYAGGDFTTAGGLTVNRIARYDGSNWSALGSGVSSTVSSLAVSVSGSDLYAGGFFTTAGGVTVNGIAKYNGSTWSALGSGMNSYSSVFALAVAGSDLYAGGNFTTAGGVTVNGIARYDGSTWSALGSGMNSYSSVFALAVAGSDLYAGGSFTTAGGVTVNGIARYDGSTWLALGSGMGFITGVHALAVSGTDLYAGGSFTTAGGKASTNIAKALLLGLLATDATYARGPGMSVKIRIADIAWDVNGNPVAVRSLGPSAQGATLSTNGTYIFYLPANDIDDSFPYAVSNGIATATGTIAVNVVPVTGQTLEFTLVDGKPTMKVAGIPGYSYDVQRAEDVDFTVNLTTVLSTTLPTDGDGLFTFVDNNPPPSLAFYRLKYNHP